MLKELMSDTIQEMLNGKLDETLGYDKYGHFHKNTDNARNGFFKKCIRSKFDNVNIRVPRDHSGNFKPQIVKKYQKDLGSIEQQLVTLNA